AGGGHPGPGQHRRTVLDAVARSGRSAGRLSGRAAGDLRRVRGPRTAEPPRRPLRVPSPAAVFQSRPVGRGRAATVDRRGEPAGRSAGERADGFVTHGTNSHRRALDELVLPAIEQGVRTAGRTDGGPRIVVVPRCITGPDEASVIAAAAEARKEFA